MANPKEANKFAEMIQQGNAFARIMASLVLGFFFSSIASLVVENLGVLEKFGVYEITFGSKWMLVLWSLGAVLFWLILTQKDRRKSAS